MSEGAIDFNQTFLSGGMKVERSRQMTARRFIKCGTGDPTVATGDDQVTLEQFPKETGIDHVVVVHVVIERNGTLNCSR